MSKRRNMVRGDGEYYYAPPPLMLTEAVALYDLEPEIPLGFGGGKYVTTADGYTQLMFDRFVLVYL